MSERLSSNEHRCICGALVKGGFRHWWCDDFAYRERANYGVAAIEREYDALLVQPPNARPLPEKGP